MILHLHRNKEYKVKTEWHEMTWRDAEAMLQVEIPAEVRDKMKGEVVEYSDWLVADGVFDYANKVLRILSDIPERVKVSPEDCLMYFMLFHVHKVADLLSATPATYKPIGMERVALKGKVYFLPASLRIGDGKIPMSEETADNFVEASNILRQYGLLKEKGVSHLNYFAAVYLREKGEGYDEERIAERAELFKDLTMDVYWEVFFCIHRLLARHITATLRYLMGQRRRALVRWVLRFGFMQWLNPVYWARWRKLRKLRSGSYSNV